MNDAFFVYVLISEVNGKIRFYTGFTNNLERRLNEHNSGKQKATKAYIPWKIHYFEKIIGRKNAREREKYFKSGSFKERLKQNWSRSSAG